LTFFPSKRDLSTEIERPSGNFGAAFSLLSETIFRVLQIEGVNGSGNDGKMAGSLKSLTVLVDDISFELWVASERSPGFIAFLLSPPRKGFSSSYLGTVLWELH
jgi:hypothetical protein